MSDCHISLIIPAYNEADNIPLILARLSKVMASIPLRYEIIIVDDGSHDASFQVLTDWHKKMDHLCIIQLSRQFGKEAALLAGLEHAQGEAIITLDADLQHPPEHIPEFIAHWQNGIKVVYGVKRQRQDPWLRRMAAAGFNRLFSNMAGFNLNHSSDFMLLDRQLVDLLIQQFPERGRFYRGLSRWLGFESAQVLFDVAPREKGQTHWSSFALFQYALNSITRYSQVPLQIVTFLGLLMLLVAMILGGEAVYSKWIGESVSGFATLEITLLFVGSLIMIGLGIIGQYLSHIYEEVKQRPLFIVAHHLNKRTDEK